MIKFENKSNGRYYYLRIDKDLFNHLSLVVIRGGHNYRLYRTFFYRSRPALQKEIDRISKRRLQRGYTLIM